MQYIINKKNIKQSIQNLSSFFKEKGFNIPRNIILDAFSKSIFFKNWNTLDGIATKPNIIQHLPNKRAYMIEIECVLDKEKILKLVQKSFEEGKCTANIDNFIYDNNSYHFEISFSNNTDNFLTSMFLLASSLKSCSVTRFDLLRIVFEKESMLKTVNLVDMPVKFKI